MEEHRKQYLSMGFAILLAYFISKLYDNLVLYVMPDAPPLFWIFSSSIFILVFIVIIYIIIYHDKEDFLKFKIKKQN